jgi:UDP-N-acetylglucosamine diphosphorylase/glucosamine-1-phosphate N-acetyltransferase
MKVIVFEDDGLPGFGPLLMLRHASQLRFGTKRLLDAISEKIPDATDVGLWGRDEVKGVTKDATGRDYNAKPYGSTLFVNARARPSETLLTLASKKEPFIASVKGELVAARLESDAFKPGVVGVSDVRKVSKRGARVQAPVDSLFRGYWDLIQGNGLAIAEQAKRFEESLPIPRGVEVRGPASNIMVDSSSDLEGHVTLDARLGPIIIDKGASVESFSRLMGPCYVGPRSKIHSAQIGGGTSIFESCKIGGQVENSIFLPFTNKAHHGYVGDSYVGSWVNLGAGSTFSNLKNTYGNVRLHLGRTVVDSGMLKLGPLIGDMAKVSIGALVYAGNFVGTGSHVSGLARGDVPDFTFYDESRPSVELLLESVIETQRRMMERRGMMLSKNEESLIRRAFASTSKLRRKAGVKRGPIR